MAILLNIHSFLRWLILIAGMAAMILYFIGLLRKSRFGRMDRGLLSGYSGLVDLQVLLGTIFFFWNSYVGGGFPRFHLEHMIIMFLAAIVAHFPVMRKKADGRVNYVNGLMAVLGSLLLIVLGVSLLPGGPIRWVFPW
ncbi:MAG: hypothetical protein JXA13_14920 [Anaerolineales bacterium]|nr:hypothetical protein [Anaerolineales bacterium]